MPGSGFYNPPEKIPKKQWGAGLISDKKLFVCKFCPKVFRFKSLHSRHLVWHSEGSIGRKHYCKICWKFFPSLTELRTHKKSHNRNKPFKCPMCLKVYVNKCSLNRHILNHDNAKLFECNYCSKTFGYVSDLNKHLRDREENKNKPIRCDNCCRRFSSMKALGRHKQVYCGRSNQIQAGFAAQRDTQLFNQISKPIEVSPNLNVEKMLQ